MHLPRPIFTSSSPSAARSAASSAPAAPAGTAAKTCASGEPRATYVSASGVSSQNSAVSASVTTYPSAVSEFTTPTTAGCSAPRAAAHGNVSGMAPASVAARMAASSASIMVTRGARAGVD